MNSDNPASRLHAILRSAINTTPGQNQRAVWRHALNIENGSDSKLYAQLGKVMALPEEISKWLIENLPNKKWETWRTAVNKAFAQIHLNGQWASVGNHLDERAMTELDMISTLYENMGGLKSITNEEISALIDRVNEIKAQVLGSGMPEEMKLTFLKYLNKILDALESYHITGAAPIMEAVESAMGHIVVDPEYKDALRETGTGEQLVNFLGSLVDAVASVQGLPPMATPFLQLIRSK